METAQPQSASVLTHWMFITACCFFFFFSFGQNPENPTGSISSRDTASYDFIYTRVDAEAEFPGGPEKMQQFIKKNLIYPPDAKKQKITGIVHLRFVVRKDGSISNIEIVNGGYGDLNIESIRMVKTMPRWLPATNGDTPVNSYVNLTLLFQ